MSTGIQGLLGFLTALLPPDILVVAIFLSGFAFFWILVCLMVSKIPGGWASFAKHYPVVNRPIGNSYSVLNYWFSRSSSGNKGARLIFTDTGIYFYAIFISRLGHPPFLLPWKSVKSVGRRRGFLDDYYQVKIADAAGELRVDLPLKVEQELSRYHKLKPVMETQSREPVALFTIPSLGVKTGGFLLLAIVIYWLSNSLRKNDLELPGRNSVAHFHGLAAWLEAASVFCFAVLVVGFFIMPGYRAYRRALLYMAWGLFIIGIIVGIWRHGK